MDRRKEQSDFSNQHFVATKECDDWPEWGICSISCGGPVQQVRTRDCRSINHLGEVISVKTDEDYQECGSVKCPEEICRDWVETVPCPISCGGPAEATFSQTCDLVDWAGTVLESNTIEEVRICAELACPETICPEWGSFDPCPLSCGGPATQTRMRTCDIMDHSGANIGSILETDTQECGNIACPSEVCEDWPEWAACSVSCGGPVEQIRSRDCNMVDHLGNIASTRTEEEFRQCGFVSCPEEVCKEWIEFQPCPISCGGPAEEKFTRVCDMVDWMGTVVSSETVEEVRVCADFPCPEVVCPEYRAYPECPVSCEGATQTRSRTCNLVDHEGNIMEEISESEEVICNNFACPTTVCPEYVDYPACPVSCEGAEQTRTRTCEIIDHTGALVETVEESESQICNNFACPNTVCPDYEEYPACPVTCAGVEQTRTRTCQTFDYKGALVEAFIESESQICNNFACPSKVCPEYIDYPVCPVSCAGAEQTRTRTCEIIDHTGALVETVEESESQICNNFACPNTVCPDYEEYPACPVTCAGVEQTRTRTCQTFDYKGALVEAFIESESQICNNFACPSKVCPEYIDYPVCPVSCAGAEQTRSRTCEIIDHTGALVETVEESESQICNNFACPNTVCPDYEEYPACPVTCAGVEQTRTRTCQTFDYKGALLEAFIESESQICNNFACPSKVCPEYIDYPVCPVTCAGAEQTRSRTCEIIDHTGALVETVEESESQICNNFACPSTVCPEYVDYPVCPVSCEGAEQTRTRTCEIIDHTGALVETVEESESQICNNFACPNTVCPDYEQYPACPVTCAGIEQIRTRTCQTFDYTGAVVNAFVETESQICNNFACPTKECPEYEQYPACPVDCEGADQTRTRTCEIIDHTGAVVETVEESESQICNNFACPNTVCPEYEEYPACPVSCGGAEQTRTRSCQTLDYTGALLKTFVESETQICNNFACPSTVCPEYEEYPACPVESPTPVPDVPDVPAVPAVPAIPAVDCSTCDYGPYGIVVYLPDPENCQCYYQCQRVPVVGKTGEYTYLTHHQCCAAGLTWRQSWMTCVTEAFKETDATCLDTPTDDITTTVAPSTSPAVQCSLQPVPGNPQYFLNANIEQFCGEHMQFDVTVCTCVPISSDIVCDSDVLLYFPFDEDLHDHSCQRAVSTQTSEASVVLVEDAQRGTVAFFDGASSLHVGFIYNYFADRSVTAWTVTVWFKRTGGTELVSGILNNGDCVGSPSFGMHLGDGQVGSVSVDTDVSSAMVAIDGVQVMHDDWQHMALVYDGSALNMYLDGANVNAVPASGAIENRQCAMNIGAEHAGTEYFEGFMDDIYIYERALSAEEVQTLSGL
ncbi:hypothetical protein CAPTEDRAFT_198362 [Capitella teleta]|uniref:LamG-like jellyroll fold domain-containing protein n=1 Tax=Capitella teleta TaxID=283909 RepID=R7T938_CAPTE|nr:hypothetical protein CAPTEDRAFT_198362 [Capitella teleta]|eukprot:ELT89948.1 hypothetical protein CAPTEDRAFT_198362 [Capitella teleta]